MTSEERPALKIKSLAVIEVELGHELIQPYRREAARRHMTLPALVNDLLVVIAEDKLVNAILDTD